MKLEHIFSLLRRGGIVAHATETCYGFACDAMSQRALARLYKLKKMAFSKPVSILVPDLKTAKKYGFFDKRTVAFAEKYWPGPLTIIVKRKKSLPSFLNPDIKTIGIRYPAHKLSRKLVKKFGRPLTTTSANISGQPSPYSVSAIKKQFRGQKFQPDFILDGGRLKKIPPSTIIDISGKIPKILRQGTLKIAIK